MHVDCPHCARKLEFSGERPSFCGYCGKTLSSVVSATTDPFDPAVTRPFTDRGQQIRREPDVELTPPASVGGYRIVKQLGSGGMGTVYQAQEESSGQRVAVKVISPDYASSDDAVERFRQEGRLASMISHPRCVFVLAADQEAGRPYIVMELMSGATLKDYVEKNGPLPVQEAVVKILDVIEGLQEAHRQGVIHRDVKPSNCFLLDDGRVKVGDFGLSKSLVSGPELTRTGTFLGTLQYASPEQIKGEFVDYRTDVYAVAATLYFLLSGRAPFQGKDAAATLARAVSESPTSLRKVRPEVSPRLEKVILRGLQRDPEKRWRNLEEFRTALLRFVPSTLSRGGMGLRTAAFVIDYLLWSLASSTLVLLIFGAGVPNPYMAAVLIGVLGIGGYVAYFAVLEGFWGATLGKWMLLLRVCTANSSDPPGLLRALFRILAFYALTELPAALFSVAVALTGIDPSWAILELVWRVVGFGVMLSTMRAHNGYRGLHELLSGTRVVRLPWPQQAEVFASTKPDRLTSNLSLIKKLPETIGPFRVRGSLQHNAEEQLLLADDPVLARRVLLYCRPESTSSVDRNRRNLARPTRLRWLSAGQHDGMSWEAYLAPGGCPLLDLCDEKHRLSWRACRGILEQLTDELAAAVADDTLPAVLSPEQVWIDPHGRVQLLDAPIGDALVVQPAAASDSAFQSSGQQRALRLIRQATRLALEGRLQPAPGTPKSIAAPVPQHASEMLNKLTVGPDRYETVADIQADLATTRDRLVEVTRSLRTVHLINLSLELALPLLLMLGFTLALVIWHPSTLFNTTPNQAGTGKGDALDAMLTVLLGLLCLGVVFAAWAVWALVFRGAFTLSMLGLTLVRWDGQSASNLRCAWRAMIVWLPLLLVLTAALVAKAFFADDIAPALAVWSLAPLYLLIAVVLALRNPTRSLHDRLAGTYLVPK